MRSEMRLIGQIGDLNGGWFRDANGDPRYRVVSGDTMSSIAQRFLGSANRAYELWGLQAWKNDPKHKGDISKLFIGDVLAFPADGVAKAEQLGLLQPKAPYVPAQKDSRGVYQLPEVTIIAYEGEADDWAPTPVMPAAIPMPQIPGLNAPAQAAPVPVAPPAKPASSGSSAPPASSSSSSTMWIVGGVLATIGVIGTVVMMGGEGGGRARYTVKAGKGPNARTLGTFSNYEKALALASAQNGVVVHEGT